VLRHGFVLKRRLSGLEEEEVYKLHLTLTLSDGGWQDQNNFQPPKERISYSWWPLHTQKLKKKIQNVPP